MNIFILLTIILVSATSQSLASTRSSDQDSKAEGGRPKITPYKDQTYDFDSHPAEPPILIKKRGNTRIDVAIAKKVLSLSATLIIYQIENSLFIALKATKAWSLSRALTDNMEDLKSILSPRQKTKFEYTEHDERKYEEPPHDDSVTLEEQPSMLDIAPEPLTEDLPTAPETPAKKTAPPTRSKTRTPRFPANLGDPTDEHALQFDMD